MNNITERDRLNISTKILYLFGDIGISMCLSAVAFFLTYQLNMKDQIPMVMVLLLVTIGAFLFLWKWIADKWAKGPTYALGLFIAFGAMASTFFLPQGESVWIHVIIFVAGFGFSA